MAVYAFCAVLGGVLLVASTFLGKLDLDGDGTPDIVLDHGALLSVRFWTFFLAFFGLTGLALTWLHLASALVTALAATAMGAVTGAGTVAVMRNVARSPNSAGQGDDYLGRTALVLVPVVKGGVGKVRLQLKGTTVDLLAITDDDSPLSTREEVLIVEIEGTRARVSRLSVLHGPATVRGA